MQIWASPSQLLSPATPVPPSRSTSMSSVPPSPNSRGPANHTAKPQQPSPSKVASIAAASPHAPRRPQRSSRLETSSSSSAGAGIHHTGATTTMKFPAIAVAPSPPGSVPRGRPMASSTEEYQAKMREWHNHIGKKYRNKLNDKFEGLQAVLVHVASKLDTGPQGPASTSSGSPRGVNDEGGVSLWEGSAGGSAAVSYAERLEVLGRMKQEEDFLEDHEFYDDDEGAEDDDDDDGEGPSVRGDATRRPRRRRAKGINKARVLAMARKTIVKLAFERDQLLRELADAGEESQ